MIPTIVYLSNVDNMKRILIVEDELMIAGNLERILIKHGFLVPAIAIDYDQALSRLREQKYDLVLLDVNLSGRKSGVDVARYINDTYHIPFFYITSYSDAKTISELQTTHPSGYIAKPLQAANLTTNIDILFNHDKVDPQEISIEIGTSIHKYDLETILYAQADHVYTEIFHDKGSDVLRISLQALQEQFPDGELVRVNRSVAVSKRAVTQIDKTSVCINDDCFKISRSLVDEVIIALK